jgi:hypothetical protein
MYEGSLAMQWQHAFESTARTPASPRSLVLNDTLDQLLTL